MNENKTRSQDDINDEPPDAMEPEKGVNGKAKAHGDRPLNKPFSQEERQYLSSLAAVDECSEKRISWNREFVGRVQSEIEAGGHPTEIFRKAGVGPEVIGRKRIERCVARWCKKRGTGGKAKTYGARPRNKPFDKEERQHLCALTAVDSCTEKRITWNREFVGRVQSEIEAGGHPTEIFRKAGVGPEVIGRKRIERCVARWREKARREKEKEKGGRR